MERQYPTYLIHYGIPGQKWGVRRFQNEDGTWTSEGLERRKSLIETGAPRKEIRKATKEGKEELKYNKELYKKQKKIGEKFDKKTEKILKDKEKGKEISKRRINKVVKLGTQYRQADYIAKDPKMYYEIKKLDKKYRNRSALSMLAFPLAMSTVGMGVLEIPTGNTKKAIDKAYNYVYEEARNITIEDLKKHNII